jgi:hypothetical protein
MAWPAQHQIMLSSNFRRFDILKPFFRQMDNGNFFEREAIER